MNAAGHNFEPDGRPAAVPAISQQPGSALAYHGRAGALGIDEFSEGQ